MVFGMEGKSEKQCKQCYKSHFQFFLVETMWPETPVLYDNIDFMMNS